MASAVWRPQPFVVHGNDSDGCRVHHRSAPRRRLSTIGTTPRRGFADRRDEWRTPPAEAWSGSGAGALEVADNGIFTRGSGGWKGARRPMADRLLEPVPSHV